MYAMYTTLPHLLLMCPNRKTGLWNSAANDLFDLCIYKLKTFQACCFETHYCPGLIQLIQSWVFKSNTLELIYLSVEAKLALLAE